MAPPYPEGLERAVFGTGCFWGTEEIFWKVPGVWTTAVGYAGGATPNPTYEEVCSGRSGHAEVVLVVFDPAVVSYEQLLHRFWETHDPTQGMRQGNDIGSQYRSVVLTTDDEQRAAAEASRARYAEAMTVAGRGPDHHRDRAARRRFLLRRGSPPAVPREAPQRLSLPRRDRRPVPDRLTVGNRHGSRVVAARS